MKYRIVILFSTFLSIFLIHGMDIPIPSEIQKEIVGIIIFNLPDAPLRETALCIRNLSLTCHSLHTFINENTPLIIKKLSTRFSCSNENVARELQTKVASEILLKQLGFSALCGNERYCQISRQNALVIKKTNIDLNFTYGYHARTQLMFSSMATKESMGVGQPYIVEWLIAQDADINIVDTTGKPAILHAINTSNDGEKQLVEYFLEHPSFDINRIYGKHGALLFAVVYPEFSLFFPKHAQYVYKISLIRKLCAKGADPEIAFKQTTLNQLQKTDQDLFDILQNTIVQKHAREQKQLLLTQ